MPNPKGGETMGHLRTTVPWAAAVMVTIVGCATRGIVPAQPVPEGAVRVHVQAREGSVLYGRVGRVIGWFDQDECDGVVGVTVSEGADYRLIFDAPSGLFDAGSTFLASADGQIIAELTAMSGSNNVKDACVAIRHPPASASPTVRGHPSTRSRGAVPA